MRNTNTGSKSSRRFTWCKEVRRLTTSDNARTTPHSELDQTRETAERELAALRGHQERVEALERDKDALLQAYAGMAPEALRSLTPEERHQVYKMLKVRAVAHVDGALEVSGALAGPIGVSKLDTVSSWVLSTALSVSRW